MAVLYVIESYYLCEVPQTGAELNEDFADREPRILFGCAPCQQFSKYSQNKDDPRWSLLEDFIRLIKESQPDIVSKEQSYKLFC